MKGISIMRKILVLCLCILALSAFSYSPTAPTAHTSTSKPSSQIIAFSNAYWYGQQYGGGTTVTLSNPGIGNDEFWERWFRVVDGSGTVDLNIGFVKFGVSSNPDWCGNETSGQLYFFAGKGSNVSCQLIGNSSPEINHPYTLSIKQKASGDMEFATFSAYGSTPCYPNPCSLYITTPAWYYTSNLESIKFDQFTNHKVWGYDWDQNGYYHSDGSFHYQFQPSPNCTMPTTHGCPSAANPPQMYWEIYPSQSGSNGGELRGCDYPAPDKACTFGS